MAIASFAARLLAWFDHHGRKDLPWQRDVTPYRVWLSEIMLQQTRVNTVIPYFERFVAVFPTLEALALAPLDQVLQHWTGLGYYARARHLHRAAGIVVERHGGALPTQLDALMALPGIGRSTAGAILALAHGRRVPILDGNVKRVLARHRAIAGWPGLAPVTARLWHIAADCTPATRVAAYTQAIMDLGATLCTRAQPACSRCPLAADCAAHRAGAAARYPGRKPRTRLPSRHCFLLVIRDATDRILLHRRPPTGVWGGLWSFPEAASLTDITHRCRELGCTPATIQPATRRQTTFSHYQLHYTPILIRAEVGGPGVGKVAAGAQRWLPPGEPVPLGLSAPVAKLLAELARPEGTGPPPPPARGDAGPGG